jgi:hypothetical protein
MGPGINPIAAVTPVAGASLAGGRARMAFQPSGMVLLTGPRYPSHSPIFRRD